MTAVAPTRLVFIRHAESRAAAEQVVGGERGCTGLTDLGVRQAQALGHRLVASRELVTDVVLASVLARAVETAEILAPALGGLPVQQDCALCELHPGECDGIAWDEYRERYAFDMAAEPDRPMSPGGESLTEFEDRVRGLVARLADEGRGQTTVAVCHGGIIVASTLHLLGAPGLGARRGFVLDPGFTSITEWRFREPEDRWELVRYNDTAHLVGTT